MVNDLPAAYPGTSTKVDSARTMVDEMVVELTAREAELMELVARGHTNKEIAERLFVSPNTVKAHLKKAFRKCGVRNRVEAAGWWARREAQSPAVPAAPIVRQTGTRSRSRLAVPLAGAAIPATLAVLALAAGAGGLALTGSSAGTPDLYCVAQAAATPPADRSGTAAVYSSQDVPGRPTARCFETEKEAISFATDGAASSIEELATGAD